MLSLCNELLENVESCWKFLAGAVWRLQGEKGIQGRPGPTGPVGIGEPGLPVSMKMVLYCTGVDYF